jgi:hypothetical protein
VTHERYCSSHDSRRAKRIGNRGRQDHGGDDAGLREAGQPLARECAERGGDGSRHIAAKPPRGDNAGMIPPLENEASALRAMLGIGPPVLLDTKPPDLLTAGEREFITKRLAAVTAGLE